MDTSFLHRCNWLYPTIENSKGIIWADVEKFEACLSCEHFKLSCFENRFIQKYSKDSNSLFCSCDICLLFVVWRKQITSWSPCCCNGGRPIPIDFVPDTQPEQFFCSITKTKKRKWNVGKKFQSLFLHANYVWNPNKKPAKTMPPKKKRVFRALLVFVFFGNLCCDGSGDTHMLTAPCTIVQDGRQNTIASWWPELSTHRGASERAIRLSPMPSPAPFSWALLTPGFSRGEHDPWNAHLRSSKQ